MEESTVENPLEDLSFEVQEAVEGLLYLGELSTDVEWCGHTIGLRTLRVDEEIAAAKAMDSFRNTLREPEAWAAAQLGLAITHIDGDDTFCPPVGPDKMSFARARFQYVTSKWYWPTIDHLFFEYQQLGKRQLEAVRAVQDLSARSPLTFSPFADSLNEPGNWTDEIVTETPQ